MPPSNIVDIYRQQGWNNDAAIQADINAGGWKTKVGGQSNGGNSVNDVIQSSFQKLNNEVAQRFGEYKTNHPFRIDEILAQKAAAAKEQIDPYYNETLSNYLTGIQNKISRSSQDTKDLLSELQADTNSYTRNTQLSLNEAINKAGQGYAGAGLLNSGQAYREQGLLTAQNQNQTSDFLRGQNFRQNQLQTGQQRNLQDINLGKQQDVRNIERQRTTDIATRQSQLAKESGQQFVTGFKATLPPELQASSGFDLLQNLGIYS